MKQIIFLLVMALSLFARYEVAPTENCPAYNNMKHSQNSHGVHLDTGRKYTVLQHHKGQVLVLVKGEQPAQRWVDESCFPARREPEISEHTKKYEYAEKPKYLLLALSWHNAFCETHRSRKECQRSLSSFGQKRSKEDGFVLHGLWPQPHSRVYCKVPKTLVFLDKHHRWNRLPEPDIESELRRALSGVMPGVSSNLHQHQWVKHGSCYGTDAQRYFEDAVHLTEQVNASKVSRFFVQNTGKRVTLQQVRFLFDSAFGKGAGRRVELRCRQGLVTELWLHLGKADETDLSVMLRNGKAARSQCQSGIIDRAGYGR